MPFSHWFELRNQSFDLIELSLADAWHLFRGYPLFHRQNLKLSELMLSWSHQATSWLSLVLSLKMRQMSVSWPSWIGDQPDSTISALCCLHCSQTIHPLCLTRAPPSFKSLLNQFFQCELPQQLSSSTDCSVCEFPLSFSPSSWCYP